MRIRPCARLVFPALLVLSGCDSGGPSGPENARPTAAITLSPATPRVGQVVTFEANARDADGRIVSYSWDLDGNGADDSTSARPTFVYDRTGTRNVAVTVTDDDGATTRTRVVLDVEPPFDQVRITQVTVLKVPFADASGAPWDPGSGPDLFVVARGPADEALARSQIRADVEPGDLPLALEGGAFTISDLSERHAIVVYDNDGPDGETYVQGTAFSVRFGLGGPDGAYPASRVVDAGAGFVFELAFEWAASRRWGSER